MLSNVLSTNCLTGAALAGPVAGGQGGGGAGPRWVARVANSPEHGDPWLQRLWGRGVYPRADLVVANSEGLERAFVRYYPGTRGGRGPRVRTMPNPTDFERLERATGRPGDDRAGGRPEPDAPAALDRPARAPEAPRPGARCDGAAPARAGSGRTRGQELGWTRGRCRRSGCACAVTARSETGSRGG